MIGTSVTHYRIVELLGGGAMGVVYKAEDLDLGRFVALKFLPPHLADDAAALARFTREAKAAAALNHPNICTVHEIGQHAGRSFIVLELLEGRTLKQVIGDGPVPVPAIARYGADIAGALAAAHAKGIVHRDIKPANLFVTTAGVVKVLDFGIAKTTPLVSDSAAAAETVEGDPALTTPGAAVGTVAYMSPEQALGQPVDARTDIYALGVVLYEMTTGARPFEGATPAAIFDQILHHRPGPASARSPDVPGDLDRVIAKALERDVTLRYQSCADLRVDLLRLGRSTDESGAPSFMIAGLRQRRPRTLIIASIAVLMAAAVSVVALRPTSAPVLTERDPIVLADIANLTGDPVFDDSLRGALAVAIGQSPYLNVVSDTRVRDTLRLMGRPPAERLSADVGREVCQREQAKAVLSGRIAELGGAYTIALEAVACASGDGLAVEEARATGKAGVLDALGAAAATLRARLGESLASVRSLDQPLARATTSSLEALKAYSLARHARTVGDETRAVVLFRRAIELDPDFALAHASLGNVLSGNTPVPAAIPHLQRAYELRGRVSEYERLYIMSRYYGVVTEEAPRTLETLQVLRSTYPSDWAAANNLAIAKARLGDYEAAVTAARDAVRLEPRHPLPRTILAINLFLNGQAADANALVTESIDAKVESDFLREAGLWAAHFRGQQARVESSQAARETLVGRGVRTAFYFKPWLLLRRGKYADATQLWTALGDRERLDGRRFEELLALTRLARLRAMQGDRVQARAAARAAERLIGEGRMPLELGLALVETGDVSGAQAWVERVRAEAPNSTYVNQLEVPQVLAAIALRDKRPEAALEALRPVGSLEASYTGSTPYLRTRALLEAGRPAEALAYAEPWLARPWLLAIQGIDLLLPIEAAKAATALGQRDRARSLYQDLLALWRDADADFLPRRQVQAALEALGF